VDGIGAERGEGEKIGGGEGGDDVVGTCAVEVTLAGVPGDAAEGLCDELMDQGADTTSVEENLNPGEEESPVFDALTAENIWERVTIRAFFPPQLDGTAIARATLQKLGTDLQESVRISSREIQSADWIKTVMDSYQPIQIQDDLWIIPEWSEPVDEKAINIILTPGLAFGTGDHPTTRLCLKYLSANADTILGKNVLDMGTGSGILSIAAAYNGAARVLGVDVDPVSVSAASRNVVLNGLEEKVQMLQTSEAVSALENHEFDTVLANIHMNVLLDIKEDLVRNLKSGGRLVLSGILVEQISTVRSAFEELGISDFDYDEEEGWVRLSGRNKLQS